jgi:serine/threonine protein kinase
MDIQVEAPEAMWRKLHLPISGIKVLKLFKEQLSTYEQGEVLDFEAVYCLGFQPRRARQAAATLINFGYDDDRGDYQVVIGDHIAYRYEVLSVLGKGSFGQVLKVLDHKTQDQLALKIIRNKSRFHHQAAVEVKILRYIRDKDRDNQFNAIHLKDYFVFRKHLCIIFELLTINLYDFLKSNNFQGLSSALIRRFAGQILVCLRSLKKLRIIHCDLKPENILLKQQHKSGIKVIDFGSSCFDEERIYTYIQSRFYRAPEIILGIPYTGAIDMWSFGCILAELATGLPLFPGESEHEQLLCIMEVRGLPPEAVLEQSSRKKMFFDSSNNPKIIPNKRGKKRFPGTRELSDVLGTRDPSFLGFLERNYQTGCFEWDPAQRLTPEAALEHPWLCDSLLRPSTGAVSTSMNSTTRGSSAQPKPVPSYSSGHRQKLSFGGDESSLIKGRAVSKQVPCTSKHTSTSFMFA